jgi:uncharacterized protein YprB with RNaseH-like and TPR domain
MLRRTFQHVPRIGPRIESRLWQAGIADWQDCLGRLDQVPLGEGRKQQLADFLNRCLRALAADDAGFFADCVTTGLGGPGDVITLVGLHDGRQAQVFVRGINMDGLRGALQPYCLVITYNGAQFDLPFIRSRLPEVTLPAAHLDLRFPLARLGYKGGLKGVEQQLGLARHPWVAGLDGYDAVILWRQYERGDRESLRRLIAYNLADVINLESLAALVYNEMVIRCAREGGLEEFEPLLHLTGEGRYEQLLLAALRQVGLAQ